MLTDNQKAILRSYRVYITDDIIKKADAENRQVRKIIKAVTEALDLPHYDDNIWRSFQEWLEDNKHQEKLDMHAKRVLLSWHQKIDDNNQSVDDVLEALSGENL